MIEGKEKHLTVSGIYSDITNGGKTAKAAFSDDTAEIMWVVIFAQLADPSLIHSKTSQYASKFPYAKVSNIEEYLIQTYGATISSVNKASMTAGLVTLMITMLVTLLFMKMLVVKDRYAIAVMKSLGFTSSDITVQYMTRSVFVSIIGIVTGIVLANTFGEALVSAVLSSFGASSFEFEVQPLSAYLFSPLMMIGAVLVATMIGTSRAGEIQIANHLKE